jgi:hypothetical protein
LEFKDDFDKGILPKDGYKILNDELDNISNFGQFVNFRNNFIKTAMPIVTSNVKDYLKLFHSYLENHKQINDRDKRIKLVEQATKLCEQFIKLCDNTEEFYKIRIGKFTTIDYKQLSLMVQTLKNIDFINGNLAEISSSIGSIDRFLNNDYYDAELENMVNKKHHR